MVILVTTYELSYGTKNKRIFPSLWTYLLLSCDKTPHNECGGEWVAIDERGHFYQVWNSQVANFVPAVFLLD